jgi:hypothetical protein
MFIHIKLLLFVLFLNLTWGERFLHCILTTLIFWSTIKIYLEFSIVYYFFSFIYKSIHMFHHIFILMPPIIQCIIEGTFMMIITWNFIYNLAILVLFVNCIKLLLISIGVFENPRMGANIWVWSFNHVSTLKKQTNWGEKPWNTHWKQSLKLKN